MILGRQITMADVAERAGVSPSAVSAAISGKKTTAALSETTRKRILQVAEELGYRPNILSRSFIKQQSFQIGMLGRECYFLFVLDTLRGIEDVLDARNYSLLTFYRGSTAVDQEKQLQRCIDRRVDGLIVFPAPEEPRGTNHQTIRRLRQDGMPIVQVHRQIFPEIPVVMVDESQIGYMATRKLIQAGHKRIAHVTHSEYRDERLPGTFTDATQRSDGYRRAMLEADLEPNILTFERSTYFTGGEDEITQYRRQRALEAAARKIADCHFTAATTFNDYIAIVLMQELAQLGVQVPRDFSLIGADNIEACAIMQPSLTSLQPPLMEIGRTAAQMIMDMLDGKSCNDVIFNPQLTERTSVGPAPSPLVFS